MYSIHFLHIIFLFDLSTNINETATYILKKIINHPVLHRIATYLFSTNQELSLKFLVKSGFWDKIPMTNYNLPEETLWKLLKPEKIPPSLLEKVVGPLFPIYPRVAAGCCLAVISTEGGKQKKLIAWATQQIATFSTFALLK